MRTQFVPPAMRTQFEFELDLRVRANDVLFETVEIAMSPPRRKNPNSNSTRKPARARAMRSQFVTPAIREPARASPPQWCARLELGLRRARGGLNSNWVCGVRVVRIGLAACARFELGLRRARGLNSNWVCGVRVRAGGDSNWQFGSRLRRPRSAAEGWDGVRRGW